MIAIICALDKELQFYYESLKEKTTHSIMGYDFIEGIINDNKVVIVKSGIGKMAAAVVTTLLIEHFKPSLVINSGIAGGYNKNLKPLDILVVNKIGCYDIDMRLDGLPFGTFDENRRFIEKDIQFNIESFATLVPLVKSEKNSPMIHNKLALSSSIILILTIMFNSSFFFIKFSPLFNTLYLYFNYFSLLMQLNRDLITIYVINFKYKNKSP